MKKIIALLFLTTTLGFSQQTIKKDLGNFNELKIFNGLNVYLIKSKKPSIEIIGDKADEVQLKNVNGKLKIFMRFPETFNAKDVAKITIYYNNNLQVIDVNEGAYVGSDTIIKQHQIDLKAQEGAAIDLILDVEFLEIKTVTGSNIIVEGKATHQNIEATTGATYEAFDLKTTNSTVLAASGAEVELTVSNHLDARVRFGGAIFYKGKPTHIKKKKIIGGTIKSND